ncbi:MAG: hypothetical protein QF464_06320, partial [Myxococcota bacterium]|nr:hypothetical protein [Myxococcota bacterium]
MTRSRDGHAQTPTGRRTTRSAWIVALMLLLGGPEAWAQQAPAAPVTLEAGQVFLSDGGTDTIAHGALYVRQGEAGGRHRYVHVIEGMDGQIWFGQPARVPGQIVSDHDEHGPRRDARWLIGTSPADTAFQAFATSDSPAPPERGWEALFSAYLPTPVLTFPPHPIPLGEMGISMGAVGVMIPTTFRGTVRSSMSPWTATFTDSVTGSRWWIERRERGVGPGDPRHATLVGKIRRQKGVTNFREITLEEPGHALSFGGRPRLPRKIVLYRHGEFDQCRFYSYGTSVYVFTTGDEATRARRTATLEALCRHHGIGQPRSEDPTPKALKRIMAHLPGAEHLDTSREDLGL